MNRKILESYDYRDELGELQFQVVRTKPKGFYQRRPVGLWSADQPYENEWVYQLGECWYDTEAKTTVDTADGTNPKVRHLHPVRNVPYRLADIRKDSAQPVLIVEGERKADLLASLGFTATCSAKGAGKWPVEFGGFFAGRGVVVMSDNDSVGELHAAQVAGSCLLYGCKSIRMVKAGEAGFNVEEGGDIYDFLMAIGRPEDGIPKLRQTRRAAAVELVKQFPKMVQEQAK